MTLPLPRNQKNRVAIRRKKIGLLKRRNAGLKKNLIRRGPQLAIAAPVSSWICSSPSWSNIVGPRVSMPFDTVEDNGEELEEGMRLFSEWTAVYDDDDEVMVEPEMHDSRLMAALLSTKEQAAPSVGRSRTLSCPDLLMDSLAVLCNCLQEITRDPTVAIPLPAPEWMVEMDPPNSLVSTVSLPSGWDAVSARVSSSSIFNLFSDLPSSIHQTGTGILSTSSTVSVPMSFWDTSSTVSVAGSAPQPCQLTSSTSSTFTPLPISRPPSAILSGASTVSVPLSFWDTPEPRQLMSSTACLVTPRLISGASTVSVPMSFWDAPEPRQLTSTTSSLFVDPSEASSSISTLFMDPSSAHSSGSLSSSFLTSSSPFVTSSSSSSTDSLSACPHCLKALDPEWPVFGYADYQDSSSSSDSASASSSSSSGYETDVDSVPTVSAVTAVSPTVQQEAASQTSTERLIAECDEMLEKLMEMKRKLREMM